MSELIPLDRETIAIGFFSGLMWWAGDAWELTPKGRAYLHDWCHAKFYEALAGCCP